MTYKEFILSLKKFATDKVTVLSFPDSCAINQIPLSFNLIFPDLIRFINNHINAFCNPEEKIALFGLQVAPGRIASKLPKQLNRSYYPQHPNDHFCCALSYLILPMQNDSTIDHPKNHHSLFIDFTTGDLIDSDHYLFLAGYQREPGKIYQQLLPSLLDKAWQLSLADIEAYHHEKICTYSG